MKKIKNLVSDHQVKILYVTQLVFWVIGACVAYLTVYRFEIFVKAVLGLGVIYLFYREFFVFRRLQPSPFYEKFDSPKDLKYLFVNFLVVLVLVWANVQVLELIRYLINIFRK